MNNTCSSRITAAAGTNISRNLPFLYQFFLKKYLSLQHEAFFLKIILLNQTFVHCSIFPTADFNKVWTILSIPMWLIIRKKPTKNNRLGTLLNYQLPLILYKNIF